MNISRSRQTGSRHQAGQADAGEQALQFLSAHTDPPLQTLLVL
jgi:hypothetical protein